MNKDRSLCAEHTTQTFVNAIFLMTKFTVAICPTINHPWVQMTDKLRVIFHNLSLFLYADSVHAETAVLSGGMVMTPDSCTQQRSTSFYTSEMVVNFLLECHVRRGKKHFQVNVHNILNTQRLLLYVPYPIKAQIR